MKHSGQVRIIGGAWRSRKLSFPAVANLRPSPDAVRETLFNWLQYDLPGCRCLDLFAGSGAFGFEAASRGAVAVTMVESNPKAIAALERNCAALNAGHIVSLAKQDAWLFLQRCTAPLRRGVYRPAFSVTSGKLHTTFPRKQQRDHCRFARLPGEP